LAPIIPEKFFTLEAPIGVTHDAKTNVVERLIVKKWFVVHASMIAEPSTSKCYRTRVFLERTNQASIRYKSLEKFCGDDRFGEKWLSKDWHFRPMPATNLWIGVQGAAQLYRHSWITNALEKDIDFVVYVFSPETILTEKHLRTFAARGRLGFPELIFDSENQHLTYNTRHGYETYGLMDGTVLPSGEPAKNNALVPRDFAFEDTEVVTEFLGTNFQSFVKVEGPVDQYSRSANSFTIGLHNFTPNRLVHEQVVATKGFADIHQVKIDGGTGVVTYKSGDDDFTYSALDDSLKRTSEPKL